MKKSYDYQIPFWEKFNLTISESAQYFGIGETTLRRLVNENPQADYILWIGNKCLIKKQAFEKILLSVNTL